MFQPLQLSDKKPLVTKNKKYIFDHPDDGRLLIKVARREGTYQRWGVKRYYKRWRRGSIYSDFKRSLKEYIFIRANSQRAVPSIQRVFGLVDTDIGLGLVVEKICGPDGTLASTLKSILRERGLTADIRSKLDAFMNDLIGNDIVVNDMGLENIVYADEGGGKCRLVLVDGFGETTLIPIYSLSKSLNRRNTLRRYRRLLQRAEAISAAQEPIAKVASD